jgi:hypothetical protein
LLLAIIIAQSLYKPWKNFGGATAQEDTPPGRRSLPYDPRAATAAQTLPSFLSGAPTPGGKNPLLSKIFLK